MLPAACYYKGRENLIGGKRSNMLPAACKWKAREKSGNWVMFERHKKTRLIWLVMAKGDLE